LNTLNTDLIESKLGRGGFGDVAKAHDRLSNEEVAIKISLNTLHSRMMANYEISMNNYIQSHDPYGIA
jgi:serine/threonine protein kinase